MEGLARELTFRRMNFKRLEVRMGFQQEWIDPPRGGVLFSRGGASWVALIPKCWGAGQKRGATQEEEKRKSKTPKNLN